MSILSSCLNNQTHLVKIPTFSKFFQVPPAGIYFAHESCLQQHLSVLCNELDLLSLSIMHRSTEVTHPEQSIVIVASC